MCTFLRPCLPTNLSTGRTAIEEMGKKLPYSFDFLRLQIYFEGRDNVRSEREVDDGAVLNCVGVALSNLLPVSEL